MKTEINISDFLETAIFGPVQIGDSMESVIEKLGQPDDYYNEEVVKPRKGFRYGWYEFMFLNNALESIQNDSYDPEHCVNTEYSNDSITVIPGILKADKIKTRRDIESELGILGIEYELVDYWGRKVLQTTANVVVDFTDEKWSDDKMGYVPIEDPNDFELTGIRYFPY